MSTLQLTTDAHYALERLLKKTIKEYREYAARFPTTAPKLTKEADEYQNILTQMLNTPILSAPRRAQHELDVRIPHYARPKHRVA